MMEVMSATMAAMDREKDLKAWIRQHEVCWELEPQFETHDHHKLQVGFGLTLLARPPSSCTLDPGCAGCAEVYGVLEEIARRVVPENARIEVEPFDGSFHLRPETSWAREVQLTVEILHFEGTFDPPDEGERRYPAAIRRHLDTLGVQARSAAARSGR
jgi:hypothetical protein